ncbi:MAG TPA: periplasmic heavy metal sensor [Bacteroidales bacterium]|nr:periplasmic heavy metal sensor [Bacteroidales bacterium]
MKNRWPIWIMVLLLILNVSAIATILYLKKEENKQAGTSPETTTGNGPSMTYSGRWFRDELGLTGEQMNRFTEFNPVFRQKVRQINIDLSDKRKQLLAELDSKNPDIRHLDQLSDSIGTLHSELKKATYAYYLEFKKICTPAQQEKLRSVFEKMFEGEVPVGGPGRNMRERRGPGMQIHNAQ